MRGICIHGHFYQPPRENAWLEAVQRQRSAAPYHDWNERIAEECYAPNAAARMLDDDGLIVALRNNYARMSFDFGPTLLSWLESSRPDVYAAIRAADAESARASDGHGAGMAQAFHHLILPLANERDRRTQVLWGVADFRARFGRDPEGMWLPETAADTGSLEALADAGIRYTVLAPSQARRWRPDDGGWTETGPDRPLDTRRPYRVSLPSGRSLAVFFYDGELSRRVAFDGLLRDGADLAAAMLESLGDGGDGCLASIATDGETYGHHHRFGDMALAHALQLLEDRDDVELTTYARFLAEHPPRHEVELWEPGSWSCAHGVERWRSDCGCQTGGEPGWSQAWRAPLRRALDWLRDELADFFEAEAGSLLTDPWAARDDYVRVVLDRGRASRDEFLARHGRGELAGPDRVRAWRLLELQRHAMMMFTSCGWFFADVDGIETRQVLQYAARGIELAAALGGPDLEPGLAERLEAAESNRSQVGHGAAIYRRVAESASVGLEGACADWALRRLILDDVGAEPDARSRRPRRRPFYAYEIEVLEEDRLGDAGSRLLAGVARVISTVTRESDVFTFGALYPGDHQLQAGIRSVAEERALEDYPDWARALRQHWDAGQLVQVRSVLRDRLGEPRWDLRTMLPDDRQAVLDALSEGTLEEIEADYRRIWQRHGALMRYLAGLDLSVSRGLAAAAEFVLQRDLHDALAATPPVIEVARRRLQELRRWDLEVDEEELTVTLEGAAEAAMRRVREAPEDPELLRRLAALVALGRELSLPVNLWRTQNDLVRLRDARLESARADAAAGDEVARDWVAELERLGRTLDVRIPS